MKDFYDWLDTDGPHQILGVVAVIVTACVLIILALILCMARPILGVTLVLGALWVPLIIWYFANTKEDDNNS